MRWLGLGLYRALVAAAGFAVAYAAMALAIFGVFRDPGKNGTPQLLALAGLAVLLVARLFERLQRSHVSKARASVWADVELGTLFVAATFALIEVTGGPAGLVYPMVFALVAFLVAFHGLWPSVYFLVLILGGEALVWLVQPEPAGWRLYASHSSFNMLFGFLYALFLRTEIAQRNSSLKREVGEHLAAISADAKHFRLTSGLSTEGSAMSAEEIAERRTVGSVQAIHEALYNVLAVAERALHPFTVALLWLDSDDRQLRVKELRSQSDHVTEKSIAAGEGLLGAISKRREPLVLTNLKPGHSGLVYYERPEAVTDFAGVPVCEGQHLRGILIADRKDKKPFDDSDLAVMATIAAEIMRAVVVERIFADMDREKYQKERFYEASRRFNAARTVDQVAEEAINAARKVADIELAAVAVASDKEGVLKISRVFWDGHGEAKDLVDKSFDAEAGLVGAAIKARHPLPHGMARGSTQCIFAPGLDVPLDAIKVLPLLWKEQGVGALVVGSKSADFLTMDLLDMLRVIADHAAMAVANAQMYERLEKMATTDGLTGLINHRHFQHLFDGVLMRAERYGRHVSMLLTDIDHFKAVNDTYGHPVGDKVLKRVAELLAASARRTDVVARYGGEEFALLMEETGPAGAWQIAERIRKTVEAETFRAETGTFKVTLSLGIGTFPMDGAQKAKLTECADQALYQAKRTGRNKTVAYGSGLNKRPEA
ncbi:MAG: GGDEF domain-containing protein [Deltaproteobacteria bacterium]|nr:GGDEF domain-containing protein [Deltaproteobacteria bacterium]